MDTALRSITITRYQTTEYNRSERMLSRLHDIYGRARSFHMSHAQILETLDAEIYKSKDFARLTPYYRGVFVGTSRMLLKTIYNYLEWRVFFDGRLIPGKEVPEGRWNEVVSERCAYVWTDAPERIF